MNTSLKQITVIINDLNEISKAAMHHANLLAKYYKSDIYLYIKDNKEDAELVKNYFGKFKNIIEFSTYNEVIKAIEKSGNTIFVVLGLKINGRNKNNENIEQLHKILEKIHIPVVTIRYANFNQQYKRIILPLDLTKATTQKVSKAIELSKLSTGTKINVLSVLFTEDQFDINRLTRQMIDVKTEIEKSGVECIAEIVKASHEDDSLGSVIVDYAHKSEADLIMIMSSSNNNQKHNIDKDVLEIITTSNLPVMNIIPYAN